MYRTAGRGKWIVAQNEAQRAELDKIEAFCTRELGVRCGGSGKRRLLATRAVVERRPAS